MTKMPKKSKLKTPEWITGGYDSKADWEKAQGKKISSEKKSEKIFKIRECPKCGSEDVGVVLIGEEGKRADNWQCHKCKWTGKNVKELELNEDEFLKRMEAK